MAMKAEEALAIAKSYTKKSLEGQGALKGEDGVSPVISVNTSTADTYKLDITDKNGTITTPNLVGKQGLQGIQGEQGKPADNPIITESADNTEDVYKLDLTVGETVFTTKNIIGKQGLEGVSPSVTTNPDNTAEDYRLNITTKGGTFTTPNLRGPIGPQGEQGESAASAINPRGDYDVNAEPHYTVSDYITSAEGNTYVCKKDNPSNVAPTDGTVNDEFWQILALRGAQGIAGKDGEKGADGVTFTPSIDANGVLSFTNNGGLKNPEPIDIKGDNGVTFTPSIDTDGYLSFTNDGNLDNPEPIKVLGKDGENGKDGINGTTYIPSIGTVTTVESNADASAGVTVDEETKEAVFNFNIPKGANGEKAVQFTPSITENGELAWENDGDLPNPPTTPIQQIYTNTPIGTVLSFAGSNAPNGYLLCDGKSYAVADYEDLYAVIGNTYGGDSTNFNVPDYRETVLVGVGQNTTDTIANHDVYGLGEFKDDQMQTHTHSVTIPDSVFQYTPTFAGGPGPNSKTTAGTSNNSGRKGTTTHGKQKGVTYIIKAFHTNEGQDEGVSDSVIDYVDGKIIDTTTSTDTVWSSQKTSDEIAKVETELEDYMNIKYNLLEPSTDLNTLIVAGRYMSKWGYSNSLVNKPSGFSSDYEVIVTVTPLKRIGNYGEYIEQTFVSRLPKSPVYRRIIENKAPTQPDWTELATMDKVADVPNTVIVSKDTKVKLNSNCYYTVINGVCYVTLWGFTCTEAGQYVVNSSMPKTRLTMNGLCTHGSNGYEGGCAYIYYDGNDNNKLYVEAKTANEPLYGSFSYPVAES